MLSLGAMNRLQQIATVLVKHELLHVVNLLGIRSFLPFSKRFRRTRKTDIVSTQPRTLRKIFEELGGGFIKLGQLLAMRPDLVGERYSREFEKLLDKVPPEDPQNIQTIIAHIPFKRFSFTPIGSGSVAQVHKAVLDGKTVAVKIRRPNVEKTFKEDIELLEFLARQIQEQFNPTFIDPLAIVQEFKDYTKRELDLSHEAANIRRFTKNFKNNKNVIIPCVYEEYSSSSILIMEYVQGITINKITKNHKRVVDRLTKVLYKMFFEDRFFHADLHPGNILVQNRKLVFLDFGIVGHFTQSFEKKMFLLFSRLVNGDLEGTADCLLDLDVGDEEPDVQVLKDGLYNVLADYYDQPLKKYPFEKMFYGAVDVARRSRVKVPATFVLFGKSLATMEGTCREIEPNFNVVNNAKPYVKKLIKKRLSPARILKSTKHVLSQFYGLLSTLPANITDFSRKFTRVEERIIDIDKTFHRLIDMLWRVAKLISLSILFATFFTVAMIFVNKPPLFFGYSIFFYIGMLASIVLLLAIFKLFLERRH